MKRGIEITCNDPALLSYLAVQEEWNLTKVDGTFYLISSTFAGLTTLEEICQAADEEIFVLNGIMKFNYRYIHLTRGNTVATFDDQENFLHAIVSKDFTTRAGLSDGINGFRKADQELSSTQIWQLAQNNGLVREALQYFSNELNWFHLNKVYEIIKRETGLAENDRIIKRGTFDKWVKATTYNTIDFTESAHRGRHSTLRYHPRKDMSFKYMSLQEGEKFVRDLLHSWLKSKRISSSIEQSQESRREG